jgi:hypothetical protein
VPPVETALISGDRRRKAGKCQLGKALKGGPSRKEEVAGTWKQAPHVRLAGRPQGRAQATAKRDRVSNTPDTAQTANSRRRTKPMRERRRPATARSRATGV